MRTSVLIICAAACLAAGGCQNQWEFKWPVLNSSAATTQPGDDVKPKAAPDRPPAPASLTPQQEIAQLQLQIKTLRQRLDVLEDENAKLRESNKTVAELQKALKDQTFTVKMQAEDLKVLKTAAVERDLYKTRSERLEREARDLNARVAKLLQRRAGENAPTTKPGGP